MLTKYDLFTAKDVASCVRQRVHRAGSLQAGHQCGMCLPIGTPTPGALNVLPYRMRIHKQSILAQLTPTVESHPV